MIKRASVATYVGLLVFFTIACNTTKIPSNLPVSEAIRLNQIGFYPDGPKVAIVPDGAEKVFWVMSPDLKRRFFSGQLSAARRSAFSEKSTRAADFSGLKQTGRFVVVVPGLGRSYPFEVKERVHLDLATASLKGFYHQRVSTPLPEKYAGIWHRAAGHPDLEVYVHPSAADAHRPALSRLASPGGWYDAGDYNKYIVNSGITMGTLLALYEDYPDRFKNLRTGIPESDNAVPDLLDEVLWNLRWMLTMQDPNDGGVYHKCTTAEFEGFVTPADAHERRYVVQKSTAAALDFAAVMAQAARVYAGFARELPGLADSCLNAAQRAWTWAEQHPALLYEQEKLNTQFDPDINTGAYGDSKLRDERLWAATELYVTTRSDAWLNNIEWFPETPMTIQNWSDVGTMAYFTLLRHAGRLTPLGESRLPELRQRFEAFAGAQTSKTAQQAYLAPIENDKRHFVWGSMAVCANQGMVLLYAFRLTNDPKYLHQAMANLDYLLGRNATGYAFVTGFGSKSPLYPHHRPSETDGVAAPVPGLLAGGPNPGQQDKCPGYPSAAPDESYVDNVCSYASNEIAINWNAPLVYLTFGVEFVLVRGE